MRPQLPGRIALALAAALLLPQVASAAVFKPTDVATFGAGIFADGNTPFSVDITGLADGTSAINAGTCATVYLASNPNQSVTSVTPIDGSVTVLLRGDTVQFTDPDTGDALGSTPACAGQNAVIEIQGSSSAPIPLVYPTGELKLQTAVTAPLIPTVFDPGETVAILDGDGQSSIVLETSELLTQSGDPVPDDAKIHTRIDPVSTTYTATLTTTNDTPSSIFLTRDGRARFVVVAPAIRERVDIVNKLTVWSDVGDLHEEFLLRFLAPGYVSNTMLTLPFEDGYGAFSLASRLSLPLVQTGIDPADDAHRAEGVKDFALHRDATDVLLYDAAESISNGAGTLSLWAKPDGPRSGNVTLFADVPASGVPTSASILLEVTPTNTVRFRFGSAQVLTAELGTWNDFRHIVATWDATTIRLYLDGLPAGDPAARAGTPTMLAAVSVGSEGIARGFAGTLDSVEISTRALSSDEVFIVDQNGAAGSLNTSMRMHSTVGFRSRDILAGSIDPREASSNHCWDATETAGALSQRCTAMLASRPQAPVQVTECFDGTAIVPCDPAATDLEHQEDSLYLAAVGAQQFGGARVVTLGTRETTDSDVVFGPGFPAGPSPMAPRFASPVSMRFRLPPKQIPDLVICNYPVVAGQPLNFAQLDGYIFEDNPDNHYTSGALEGRFKCATSFDDPVTGGLRGLRANYGYVLRDNMGDQLTTAWKFKFKLQGPDDLGTSYGFPVSTYDTLNDATGLALVPMGDDSGREWYQAPVTTIIDNVSQTAKDLTAEPEFTVTESSGLFDITLPGDYTRLAAMTIPSATGGDPARAGFAELSNVQVLFQVSGSGTGYFQTLPFRIRYEVQPAAPTITTDRFRNPTGFCDAFPDDPTCEKASEVLIGRHAALLSTPEQHTLPANQLFAGGLDGTVSHGAYPVREVQVTLEELSSSGAVAQKRYWQWGSFAAYGSLSSPPPDAAAALHRITIDAGDDAWSILSTLLPTPEEGKLYRLTLSAVDAQLVLQAVPTIVIFQATTATTP